MRKARNPAPDRRTLLSERRWVQHYLDLADVLLQPHRQAKLLPMRSIRADQKLRDRLENPDIAA